MTHALEGDADKAPHLRVCCIVENHEKSIDVSTNSGNHHFIDSVIILREEMSLLKLWVGNIWWGSMEISE